MNSSDAAALALATPIILEANPSPAQLKFEWERMITRSRATDQFVRGELSLSDWEEILDACGVDVIQADHDWALGLGYL